MKIYRVNFNQYTNGLNNCVSNEDGQTTVYLKCDSYGDILVMGNDLNDINWLDAYGNGIRSVKYLGDLTEEE